MKYKKKLTNGENIQRLADSEPMKYKKKLTPEQEVRTLADQLLRKLHDKELMVGFAAVVVGLVDLVRAAIGHGLMEGDADNFLSELKALIENMKVKQE